MKRALLMGVLFAALVVTSIVVVPREGRAQGPGDEESKIRRGFQIAPVPLNLARRNRALVGLGSYLVNSVGDCNGCHTVDFNPYLPDGDPFAGQPEMIDPDKYLVGGRFSGSFGSRNLRPHVDNGLPAGLTFEQFLHVLRTGEDLDNIPPAPLLQVMPWPAFGKMTDRDIRAMYEYLSSLPPHAGYPE